MYFVYMYVNTHKYILMLVYTLVVVIIIIFSCTFWNTMWQLERSATTLCKDSPSSTTSRRCRDLQGWVCLLQMRSKARRCSGLTGFPINWGTDVRGVAFDWNTHFDRFFCRLHTFFGIFGSVWRLWCTFSTSVWGCGYDGDIRTRTARLQKKKRVDWGCLFKTLRAPINHLNQLLLPELWLIIVLNVIPSPSETCVHLQIASKWSVSCLLTVWKHRGELLSCGKLWSAPINH